VPGKTFASNLESVGISTDFAAGVLSANLLEGGLHFGLGSTLAFSRDALNEVGGFAPLLDYLADDYELGRRIAAAGYKIVLSDVVVDTFLPDYTFGAFFDHQLRWGRTIRDSRRLGYLGLALTFGVPWSLIALVLSYSARWAIAVFTAALVSRFMMAMLVAGSVLHDRYAIRNLLLVPLRDFIALFVWMGTYLSHKVVWRGEIFALKHGKLVRIGN
jgi:ceramide glucosyltransferase